MHRIIMKNANLSNSTRHTHIAYTQATRIVEELLQQTEYSLIEYIDLLFILFFNYIYIYVETKTRTI